MSSGSKLQNHGYNQEEMYFHKRELELIKNLKSAEKANPNKDSEPAQRVNPDNVITLPTPQRKKAA